MTRIDYRSMSATFSDTQLVVAPGITEDQFWRLGEQLGALEHATRWWIGDWLLHGESSIPDMSSKYDLAIMVTGLSRGTLMNIRSIAYKVPPHRRRPELPFSFHGAVTSLDGDSQSAFLDRAVAERWTREELRRAVVGRESFSHATKEGRVLAVARVVCDSAKRRRRGYLVPEREMLLLAKEVGAALNDDLMDRLRRVVSSS